MEIPRLALQSSCVSLALCYSASALSDIIIEPNIGAEYTHQEAKTPEIDRVTSNAYVLTPSLRVSLESEVAEGYWYVENSRLESKSSIQDSSENFTEFEYQAERSFIRDRLLLRALGSQTYRSVRVSDELTDDILLNASNLTQTRQNQLFSSYQTDESGFARGTVSANYLIFQTNESLDSDDSSTNQTFTFNTALEEANSESRINWDLDSSYQQANRSFDEDVIVRDTQGNIDIEFVDSFSLRLTGRNDVTNINSEDGTTNTKFNSYGYGLSYENNNNSIALTYNISKTNDEEAEDYVGLDFNYNLSTRTSINGSFDKRFYGDSSSLDIRYEIREFRASLSYDESVLISFSGDDSGSGLSTFVCPVGSDEIQTCFQPTSLSYDLAAGEEFVDFFTTTSDLTEQTRISKTWNSTFGYESQYFRVSLQLNDTESDFLEEDVFDQSRGGTLTTSYRVSPFTQINYSLSYQLTDQDNASSADLLRQKDEVITSNINLQKAIGRRFQVDFTYRYLKRSSNIVSRDIRENRFQVNMLYRFGSQYSNRSN